MAVSRSTAPLRGLRESVVDALDRTGCYGVLAALGSGYLTARNRQICRLRHEDGVWLHRYRNAVIADMRVGGPGPDWLAEAILDEFCFGYRPRAGDTVLDVGAGIGSETLVFARAVGPGGRVIAIEAHPRPFACLEAVCRHNRLTNVTAVPCAVSDVAGELLMTDSAWLTNSVVATSGSPTTRVRARTLDDLIEECGVHEIDLLKMNIEGAEAPALAGAAEALSRTRHAVVQCHDFRASEGPDDPMRTSAAVRAQLERHGLEVVSRPDHPHVWVRNTLYASRPGLSARYGNPFRQGR
jgi:FkbM family methyltransferase